MKKSGFTLIEMIIVLALTVIILAIASSVFVTGNKVFSDSDVKSTLQIEGQAIQENISKIGMESISIDGITDMNKRDSIEDSRGVTKKLVELSYDNLKFELTDNDGIKNVEESKNKWLDISKMRMNSYEENNDTGNITGGNLITIIELVKNNAETTGTLSVAGKELSNKVKSVRIKPINIDDGSAKFKDADSILINIVLAKKNGYSDVEVEYPISIEVKFRNNFMKSS